MAIEQLRGNARVSTTPTMNGASVHSSAAASYREISPPQTSHSIGAPPAQPDKLIVGVDFGAYAGNATTSRS